MFELIPYILELDPETEIKLIEDLEPGKDGLPKMSKILPTMMVNTKTGEKVLTLIKESHMKEFMSKAELMSAHNVQLKEIKSHENSRQKLRRQYSNHIHVVSYCHCSDCSYYGSNRE